MRERVATVSRLTLPNGSTIHSINRNESRYLYQEIFEDRVYLHPAAFRIPPHPVVFDIGANIGLFTLFCESELEAGEIHSFEPVPDIFRVLTKNLASSAVAHPHEVAVGNGNYSSSIRYYPHYTMMSGFTADPTRDLETVKNYVLKTMDDENDHSVTAQELDQILAGRFEQVTVPCRVETLTTIVERLRTERIDLLKIDVEGHELAVLQGMDRDIWARVAHAVVEVSDTQGELDRARRLFEEHGMRAESSQVLGYRGTNLYMLYGWRPENGSPAGR
jgi:31-O-methyltransferase